MPGRLQGIARTLVLPALAPSVIASDDTPGKLLLAKRAPLDLSASDVDDTRGISLAPLTMTSLAVCTGPTIIHT